MESRSEKIFLHVVSVVSRGQEMFCGCRRFRFGVRVIYGKAVFIKSVQIYCFEPGYIFFVTLRVRRIGHTRVKYYTTIYRTKLYYNVSMAK